MQQTISQSKALRDHASKLYLSPRPSLRRLWICARIWYAEWQVGNSDSALFKMHVEREQVNDAIAEEMRIRVEFVQDANRLKGLL